MHARSVHNETLYTPAEYREANRVNAETKESFRFGKTIKENEEEEKHRRESLDRRKIRFTSSLIYKSLPFLPQRVFVYVFG